MIKKLILIILLIASQASMASEWILLTDQDETLKRCMVKIKNYYGIDPLLLWSIKLVESGNRLTPPVNKNKNGTMDYSITQINSIWIKNLKKHGISYSSLSNNCQALNVSGWILSQCIKRKGLMNGIGCYHSSTPKYSVPYRNKVIRIYNKIWAAESKKIMIKKRIKKSIAKK